MTEQLSNSQFLQGFLAEAQDHLRNVQNLLLRFEMHFKASDDSTERLHDLEQAEMVKSLFRSFHTLKGMAGMVGLRPAVELSHAVETLLRAVQQGDAALEQPLLDQLFSSTELLNRVVESAGSSPTPDVTSELQKLNQYVRSPEAGRKPAASRTNFTAQVSQLLPELTTYPGLVESLGEYEWKEVLAAAQAQQFFQVVLFSPSQERSERGITVDLVRERIEQAGKIIKAVPDVESGKVRFLFLTAAPQPLQVEALIADMLIPLTVEMAYLSGVLVEQNAISATQRSPIRAQNPLVRVELDRLEDMVRITGELEQLRLRLDEDLRHLESIPPALRWRLRQTNEQINRRLHDLQRSILHARMVPLTDVFHQMTLVVRDTSRAAHKEVRLVMHGETIEVDKLLAERLLEPLIHLVRNAIIHGIELPAERSEAGKDPQGTITLWARRDGDFIWIEVGDDGRGVNVAEVAGQAVSGGLLEPGVVIDSSQALALISIPGFSTMRQAGHEAGRGVGLDVVQRVVRETGGRLVLRTTAGQGAVFSMRMPLTLVTINALIVQAGGEWYALPRDNIQRILDLPKSQIVRGEAGETAVIDEVDCNLYRLTDLVGSPDAAADTDLFGLVLRLEGPEEYFNTPVVVVEHVLELREVIVRSLSDPLLSLPGLTGITELRDGRPVFILDLFTILTLHQNRAGA